MFLLPVTGMDEHDAIRHYERGFRDGHLKGFNAGREQRMAEDVKILGSVELRTQKPLPPPGSDEARADGCTCPVMDNRRGRGAYNAPVSGEPQFWVNGDCPMHGIAVKPANEKLTPVRKRCVWTEEDDGWGCLVWHTGCDHRFEITEGTPTENQFQFCIYCGRPLKEKRGKRD